MSALTIKRGCPDCPDFGLPDGVLHYAEKTACHTCNDTGHIWIPLAEATDDELDNAVSDLWALCGDANWQAGEYAYEAQQIEAEQERRRKAREV